MKTDSTQIDLLSEQVPIEKGGNDPEIGRVDELARQNQNLRLLAPIYQIEQSKGKIGERPSSELTENAITDNIDTVYLSILSLEYYASYALSRESIPAQEVIEYLQTKVVLMDSNLSDDDSLYIAKYVHNSLCNQKEGYQSFSYPYFDPLKHKMLRYEFWLISIVSSDAGNSCKITEEGITGLLTYINANPKLQDEVTALLTQKLIETGRYQEAIQMAERSRKTVIQYQEKINTATDRVRRDAKPGEISKNVLPLINESTEHVKNRINEEDKTLDSLSELQLDKLEKEAIKLVSQLKDAIRINLSAYKKLYQQIERRHNDFNSIFRLILRPTTGRIPNLVNGLLERMSEWDIETLSTHGDGIINEVMPAQTPSLFDVITILDQLDTDGEKQIQDELEDVEPDMDEINRLEPLFSKEMIEDSKRYYLEKISTNKTFTLQQLLKEAEQESLSYDFQRCLSYVVVMSYTDKEAIKTYGVRFNIKKKERFQHHFLTGDNLVIKKLRENDEQY